MGTGRAELDTTTSAAGAVASAVEDHVRGLPDSVQDSAQAGTDEVSVVRGWTVTGGTAAEVLRVTTDVRQVTSDATEIVDDAESYAQLQGIGHALRAAGFVVDEVLEGWRTVAVDVAVAAADSDVPTDAPKHEKSKKAKNAKKAKPPKVPKQAKTGRAKNARVPASDAADPSGTDAADAVSATAGTATVAGPGESPASAPTPKKNRVGLLRRRSAPLSAELADQAGVAATGVGSEATEATEDAVDAVDAVDADKDLAPATAA